MSKNLLSASKKVKVTSGGNDDNDKLGNLPEVVLSHILSLLPTKDAVRTSVLSTKWRYKWALITNLYFDDSLIYSNKKRKSRKTMFINFVERVLLLLGNSTIEEFNLSCSMEEYDHNHISMWILAAMRHDAQKIKITCPLVNSLAFPCLAYFCGTISELELQMNCAIKIVPYISFSSLKIMDLYGVTFLNKCISSPRELILLSMFLRFYIWLIVNGRLSLLSKSLLPKLKSISIKDEEAKKKVARVLAGPSAIVDLCVEVSYSVLSDSDKVLKTGDRACKLLGQFSNAKNLTISSAILKHDLPKLNNLIQLTLTFGKFDEKLRALLRRSPVLESLTFTQSFSHDKKADLQGMDPQCLLSHLKVVEFQGHYMNNKGWIELARFLLKNATALEKMIINFRHGLAAKEMELLLECPRCSSQASIVFTK